MERLNLWLRYQFERFLMQGPLSRLLLVLALIWGIACWGGVLAYLFSGSFSSLGEAVWWAFLRLTDPGYLGDDQGLFLRSISTLITVLGYVVFLGALVAIMTQWFHQTMGELSAGLTRIVKKNHIVVIGSTNRTTTILRELFLSSGRVHHFLRSRGAGQLHVALLSERAPAEVLAELRSELGEIFDRSALTIRYGSPLRLDHLRRVDFLRASAIVVPADDERGLSWTSQDEETVKILLALGQAVREESEGRSPVLVAEVSNDERAGLARLAYRGDSEMVPTEQMVAWMIAQEVKCPGTLRVFDEILAQEEGHRLYVTPAERFVGRRVFELAALLPEAVVVGVIRGSAAPLLNPEASLQLEAGDRLVALARDLSLVSSVDESFVMQTGPAFAPRPNRQGRNQAKKVLLLGWSRKAPAFIDALSEGPVASAVDVFARVPSGERRATLERWGLSERGVTVRHFEGDTTSVRELSSLEWDSYDHILLVASDRLESDAESDARTILTSFAVEEVLSQRVRPQIMVEMLHPESAALLEGRQLSVVQSAAIPSLLLTQICISRELHRVLDDLVRPRGAELRLFTPRQLGLPETDARFLDLFLAVLHQGMTLFGVLEEGAALQLVPGRDAQLQLTAASRLVVLLNE